VFDQLRAIGAHKARVSPDLYDRATLRNQDALMPVLRGLAGLRRVDDEKRVLDRDSEKGEFNGLFLA